MNLFRFIFPFLYTRDWYSGRFELSRPRVVLFSVLLTLVILAVLVAAYLQMPVKYTAE